MTLGDGDRSSMNFMGYIRHNWQHYSRRAREALDVWIIRHYSQANYQRMTVPSQSREKIDALRASYSLLSNVMALNDTAVGDADRIIGGHYRIFGREIQADGGKPDWHRDYFSGHRYSLQPYLRYVINENTGADIIVPWELSRFLFVPTLVSAYRTTGDQKYARHFYDLIDNWVEQNPYLFGINWMCGLDIAIRAFNIALGFVYFDGVDPARQGGTARLLWAHLRYLQERDLYEPKQTVNNHQLVAALLHYGLLHLFDSEQAAQWRQDAQAIVVRELALQFNDDGGNYESALLYHQFVLEALYATIALVGDDAGPAGEVLQKTALEATRFSAAYIRSWQGVPQIGDSSDGRIVVHQGYFSSNPTEAKYLEDWSKLIFQKASPFLESQELPEVRIFKESGLATFRNQRYGAVFSAMPVNVRAAGHNHLDKTSFVLRIGNTPVLVDAGTFCYTSDTATRQMFRSGRAHNVVLIDNEDQASYDGPGAFSAPLFGDMGISLEQSDATTEVRLWHDGYRRMSGLGRLDRSIRCSPDSMLVSDRITGEGRALVEVIFNIHPDLTLSVEGNIVQVLSNNGIICSITVLAGWEVAIEQGGYSESYGARLSNSRVVISSRCTLPIEMPTLITIHETSC